MISTKKLSLFDVPQGSIIVHACNSQGMWGSGIAKAFAARYPHSYAQYKMDCSEKNQERGTGCGTGRLSFFHVDEPHWVGWIITSHNYGKLKDSPEQIKVNTTLALLELCQQLHRAHPKDQFESYDVYSNKFNSGLFDVPWEQSELILNTVLRNYPRINWIICDPND